MQKETIYISGPINGLDRKYAEQRFLDAEKLLEPHFNVINPVKIPKCENPTWSDCLIADLEPLYKEATNIFMLDGWRMSRGARIEFASACELDFNIYFETHGIPHLGIPAKKATLNGEPRFQNQVIQELVVSN